MRVSKREFDPNRNRWRGVINQMSHFETTNKLQNRQLPMRLGPSNRHFSARRIYRHRPDPAFISQLVVAKQLHSKQLARPAKPTSLAEQAYSNALARKVKRIPVGFSVALSA